MKNTDSRDQRTKSVTIMVLFSLLNFPPTVEISLRARKSRFVEYRKFKNIVTTTTTTKGPKSKGVNERGSQKGQSNGSIRKIVNNEMNIYSCM